VEYCYKIKPFKLTNKDKQNPHGKILVEQLGEDRLPDFIKLWRNHFLKTMNPKFLPLGWSVDHKIERSFGVYSKFNHGHNIEMHEGGEQIINIE